MTVIITVHVHATCNMYSMESEKITSCTCKASNYKSKHTCTLSVRKLQATLNKQRKRKHSIHSHSLLTSTSMTEAVITVLLPRSTEIILDSKLAMGFTWSRWNTGGVSGLVTPPTL